MPGAGAGMKGIETLRVGSDGQGGRLASHAVSDGADLILDVRAEGFDAVAVPLGVAPAGERSPVVRDDEGLLVFADDDIEQGVNVVGELLPRVFGGVRRFVLQMKGGRPRSASLTRGLGIR